MMSVSVTVRKGLRILAASAVALIFGVVVPGPDTAHASTDLDLDLLEASAYRTPETIADLLAKGANPNAEDGNGVTPLINIAARGNTRSMLLLLDAGARIDEDGKNGCIPLTWAARNGWEKLVETLVARGSDINHRDLGGMTPLMRASWNGQLAAVEALVRLGANVNLEDEFGNTALTYALAAEHRIIQALLRASGATSPADDAASAAARVDEKPFTPCVRAELLQP